MKLTQTKNRLVKTAGALSLIAAFIFNPLATVTQAANEISRLVPFQGRLHGTDNKAVADGVYDITFNVYDTPTGGTPSWTESHSQVSVIHGYVNVLLGAITPMHDVNYPNVTATPAYDSSKNHVDFTKKKYLGISINGGVEMFPRSQLVPSFHAYTANHADHASTSDHAFQADNSDLLENKSASYFATASGITNSNSRISTLEGRFTGEKSSNADKLDSLDSTGFMRQESRNGYFGFMPNGSTSTWVRTPQSGLLPYQSGGHGSLGTSSWRFNNIHGNNIYDSGTLLENKYLGITSKAVDSEKLDDKDSTYFMPNSHIKDLVPVGTILAWPTSNVPEGYLECNGALIPNSTYPELKTVLGTTYGGSSTHFNLPDYRGWFLRGWAHGSSTDPDRNSRSGGDTVGSSQSDQFKTHNHGWTGTLGDGYPDNSHSVHPDPGHYRSFPRQSKVDNEGGNETRPKNIAVMYIIKAKSHTP